MVSRLSGPSEHMWSVMVRQSYVDGIMGILFFVFSSVFFCVALKYCPKGIEENYEDNFGKAIANLVILLAAFTIFAASIIDLPQSIRCLINPEYYAIIKLLE